MHHADCNLRPENIYVSEIKYQKYQQNIDMKEIAVLDCETAKNSALARIFIDFLNVIYMFLR